MSDAIQGLDNMEAALSELLQSVDDGVLRATEAAAGVIDQEVKARAKGSIRDRVSIRSFRRDTGAKAIIQVEDSGPTGEEHHAVFLEYGTSRMAAQPFMRPGYEAAAPQAIEAFTSELGRNIKR